jgi:hypothetical protein
MPTISSTRLANAFAFLAVVVPIALGSFPSAANAQRMDDTVRVPFIRINAGGGAGGIQVDASYKAPGKVSLSLKTDLGAFRPNVVGIRAFRMTKQQIAALARSSSDTCVFIYATRRYPVDITANTLTIVGVIERDWLSVVGNKYVDTDWTLIIEEGSNSAEDSVGLRMRRSDITSYLLRAVQVTFVPLTADAPAPVTIVPSVTKAYVHQLRCMRYRGPMNAVSPPIESLASTLDTFEARERPGVANTKTAVAYTGVQLEACV